MSYGEIVQRIRAIQPTNNGRIMSYAKFSKITGISATQLERLEKEQSNPPVMKLKPTIDILKQICDRTGYSFRQFLEEAGYIEAVPVVEPSVIQQKYDRMTNEQKQLLLDFANVLVGDENTPLDTFTEAVKGLKIDIS